jgi:hypothetical protein
MTNLFCFTLWQVTKEPLKRAKHVTGRQKECWPVSRKSLSRCWPTRAPASTHQRSTSTGRVIICALRYAVKARIFSWYSRAWHAALTGLVRTREEPWDFSRCARGRMVAAKRDEVRLPAQNYTPLRVSCNPQHRPSCERQESRKCVCAGGCLTGAGIYVMSAKEQRCSPQRTLKRLWRCKDGEYVHLLRQQGSHGVRSTGRWWSCGWDHKLLLGKDTCSIVPARGLLKAYYTWTRYELRLFLFARV